MDWLKSLGSEKELTKLRKMIGFETFVQNGRYRSHYKNELLWMVIKRDDKNVIFHSKDHDIPISYRIVNWQDDSAIRLEVIVGEKENPNKRIYRRLLDFFKDETRYFYLKEHGNWRALTIEGSSMSFYLSEKNTSEISAIMEKLHELTTDKVKNWNLENQVNAPDRLTIEGEEGTNLADFLDIYQKIIEQL